ncbi:MAG: mechanosensitive ion channel domain-containing protein [Gemmatimonadaceae bacterium]
MKRTAILSASIGAILCLAAVCPAPVRAQASSEEVLAHTNAVQVRFRGQDLFEVRAPVGELRPPERARAIEDRLITIAQGSSEALDAIQVVERERTSDLMAGDQLVLSVTDADALPLGRTRQQLAADYSVRLHTALSREFSGRSLRGIVTAVALASLATLLLVLALRLMANGLGRVETRVRSWEGTRIPALRVQSVELLSANRMTAAAVQSVTVLRWLLFGLVIVIYLETVLGFFPFTRAAALQFRTYALGAVGSVASAIIGYMPNVVYIALIVVVVRFVLRAEALLFESIERGELRVGSFHPEWAVPTSKIVRFMIVAFAAVVVFPYLPGAGSPAFQGVSIFFGVLFSLGSSSAVANVVAGIVMTYMIPFRPGDRVKIGETVGDVMETNLLVVRIKTIKNVEITIPNASVLGGHIINYSGKARDGSLILHSTVTIGYDVPWRSVHALLIAAAGKTGGLLPTPEPFVLQTSLDDFYVSYQINAFSEEPNRMAVIYGELHQHIQDEFAAAGVEIMSPHYRAMRDGNMVTLPSDQLPADYVVPPFRVATIRDADAAAQG